MPQPNGYRKALRFMKHANQFGFPILTFVDTPGAFAGKSAEELGQVRFFCSAAARPCKVLVTVAVCLRAPLPGALAGQGAKELSQVRS